MQIKCGAAPRREGARDKLVNGATTVQPSSTVGVFGYIRHSSFLCRRSASAGPAEGLRARAWLRKAPMPPPTTRSPEADTVFLTALENGHSVRNACGMARYTRRSADRWRAEDPDLAARWATAMQVAVDFLEEEADRRGRDGYDTPVSGRGVRRETQIRRRPIARASESDPAGAISRTSDSPIHRKPAGHGDAARLHAGTFGTTPFER